MTHPTVPETKPVAELKSGDWIDLTSLNARSLDLEGSAVVRYAETFKEPGYREPHTMVMFGGDGRDRPWSHSWPATTQARLLTDAERAAVRELAERAQRIADIRAFADFLEQHPALPVTNIRMQASLNPHGDVWNSGAEGVAEVQRLAELFDCRVKQDDEHITATREAGASEYVIVAWHKDGRPVEAEAVKPLVSDETIAEAAAMEARDRAAGGAPWEVPSHPENFQPGGWHHGQLDPTGLTYSREEDPTPVSPARGGPVHTGGVVDGGGLVDETPAHVDIHGGPIPADALCVASLHIPAAGTSCGWCGAVGFRSAQHVEVMGTASSDGECSAECACGTTMAGFDTLAEASAALAEHIADATAKADSPAEPWIAQFFTFGSGHVSESGEDLYGRYVAVIGPDRESCRAAMITKYGAEWAFQYDDLPDGALYREYDVIDLSAVEPVSEAR